MKNLLPNLYSITAVALTMYVVFLFYGLFLSEEEMQPVFVGLGNSILNFAQLAATILVVYYVRPGGPRRW